MNASAPAVTAATAAPTLKFLRFTLLFLHFIVFIGRGRRVAAGLHREDAAVDDDLRSSDVTRVV